MAPSIGLAAERTDTYTNPVSNGTFDVYPDPTIIRGKDSYWYAYATGDLVRKSYGDDRYVGIPIAKSKDMTHWKYVGEVFTDANRPAWHPKENTTYWAPDIRYLNGKYYLYYTLAHSGPDSLYTIGVATAPTPTGPWTDSGGEVTPRGACNTNNIDPAEFTDRDGTKYLYWGSYGDICGAKLSDDGTRLVGKAVRLTYGPQAEASYVVRRGGYYYLFISEGGCCSGAFSSYQVEVARSKSPLGPFVDRDGVSMTASRRGGTIILAANGNKWVGPGHNSVATDLSGQDWMVYHAIPKDDPYLPPPPENISRRPMMIDRLDWIDGWPTVRAGRWASEGPQKAPVTAWTVGSDFNGRNALAGWRAEGTARGGWKLAREEDSGGYVRQKAPARRESYLVSKERAPADVRAEADLRLASGSRGAVGLVAAYRGKDNHVAAWLDAGQNALVVSAVSGRRGSVTKKAPLPSGFDFGDWHNVAVEIRGRAMSVEVTDARLHDPLATERITLPRDVVGRGSVGVASRAGRAEADNVGAARLYRPVEEAAPAPKVGALDPAYSDEFDSGRLGPEWSWVRTPDGEETGGAYVWQTQNADLYLGSNNASVLLRDAPEGDYTVETRLGMDLGTDTERSYQQAGLVAYANDDEYAKLSTVAIGTSRRTEFAKEDEGRYGGMTVGPPSDTTWLRLVHRVDPKSGEHEYRAETSTDGRTWTLGGVWTFPAGSTWRIGLVSLGNCCSPSPPATARFDYFRVYRP
jgi:beta-xylosidase